MSWASNRCVNSRSPASFCQLADSSKKVDFSCGLRAPDANSMHRNACIRHSFGSPGIFPRPSRLFVLMAPKDILYSGNFQPPHNYVWAANQPAANQPAANQPAANQPAANQPAPGETGGRALFGYEISGMSRPPS